MRRLKQLIERLIDRAKMELYSHDKWRPGDSRKPGDYITRLAPEERSTLEKLAVEDLQHRIDVAIEAQIMEGWTPGRKGRLGKHLEEERIKHIQKEHK